MEFEIKGKKYDLKFGLKFIRELDKIYVQMVDGMAFGIGVESAIMYLQMKNPTVLYDIIKAGTSHLKSKPPNSAIENELEERAINDELDELFKEFQLAMESSVFLKPKLSQMGDFSEIDQKRKQKEEEREEREASQ